MENRLEILRQYVDNLVCKNTPERTCSYAAHMYAVSKFCAVLAKKRNLNTEIASTCGMLHDIGYMEVGGSGVNHASTGANRACSILRELDTYREEEIETITTAIKNHSDKLHLHGAYDELLKDADVLDHCFYDNDLPIKAHELERYTNLLVELGMNDVK